MNRLCSILTVHLIIISAVFAQGEYLRKGESGFGISPAFTSIQSNTAVGGSSGVSIGYSYKTVVDLNIGYAKSHIDETSAITSSLSYFLDNQTNKNDETSAISLLLQNSDGNTNIGFAFSFAHNFLFDGRLILQPNFNVSVYPAYKQTYIDTKSEVIVSAGLSMGWRSENGHSISLAPIVAYQDTYVYLGAALNVVLLTP
jgi:hypothetical protein